MTALITERVIAQWWNKWGGVCGRRRELVVNVTADMNSDTSICTWLDLRNHEPLCLRYYEHEFRH